ncbi:MAG: hypothetical protein H3C57_06285 [Gammaproteobacteria bacterium]|nr:hypothetical protein [Gammaproteobacteria bacterium]
MAVAQEAARLMQEHGQRDFRAAKAKAGQRLGLADQGVLPSNEEVASAMAAHNRIFRGEDHEGILDALRRAALGLMNELAAFDPRLVGTVLSGHANETGVIELHVFSDAAEEVGTLLDEIGLPKRACDNRLRIRSDEWKSFPGYHCRQGDFEFTLSVFPERGRGNAPLSAVDGRPMRRAKPREVAALLAQRSPTST